VEAPRHHRKICKGRDRRNGEPGFEGPARRPEARSALGVTKAKAAYASILPFVPRGRRSENAVFFAVTILAQ
jgi:hypothetical protein